MLSRVMKSLMLNCGHGDVKNKGENDDGDQNRGYSHRRNLPVPYSLRGYQSNDLATNFYSL